MGGAVGDYRAYILGIDGHRFVWVSDFKTDYRDDSAALDAARQLSDKHDVEVWDGGRLVALLSPSELPPPLAPSVAPDSEQIAVEPSDSGKIAVEPPEPASPSQFSKLVAALSLKK
jgi:hypothetical protein